MFKIAGCLWVLMAVCISSVWAEDADALSSPTHVKSSGGYAITAYDRQSNRQFGGYFDTEFSSSSDDTNSFKAHRLVLQASAKPHARILFNTEIEYEYGGYLKSGGADTQGELKVEQAWLDYQLSPAAIIRTGIILMPVGRVNILHDSDVRDTTNRGIFAKYIVPTTWMDTGTGMHGIIEQGDWLLNYEAYVVNGLSDPTGANITSSSGIRSTRPNFKADNNQHKAVVGRLGISPVLGLEFGGSYYTGRYDDNDAKNIQLTALDGTWKSGAMEFIGEWAHINRDAIGSSPAHMNGFYVEGRYHLMGDWLTHSIIGEGFTHPVITLFARFSQVDLDTSVSDANDLTQYTLGFNFRPIETVAFKFEYEINHEKMTEKDNNAFVASVAAGF